MIQKVFAFLFDNLTTKIVSVLVAIVLWIVVLSSRNVDISKDVPLEVITSSEVVVGNELPDRITFQLSGPKAFRRAVQERNEAPIRINLTGVKPGTVSYSFSPEDIRLPLGMKVASISPANIRVKLETMRYTHVKVRADIRGEPEKGYRIIRTEVSPEQVQIKGSKTQLSNINEIVSVPVNINGATQDIKQPLSFELSHLGVSIEGPTPTLTVRVEPVSPNFRLRNVGVKVLSPHAYKLSDSAVTVFVRASPEDLKSLDHNRVFAEIDLRGQKKGKYTIGVKVNTPKSMSVIRVVPDKIDVTLY